ncbi:putative holin-like toxin, partial [Enterococcus faecalis]
MSVFEALSLMIAFATLLLLFTDNKNKKKPSNTLTGRR